MKFFAVVFRYKDYEFQRHHVGVNYIEAVDEAQALDFFGRGGVLAVKEIGLDDLVKTGAHE